jgi:hypothetical protein
VCPDRGQLEEIPLDDIFGPANIEFDMLALGHEHYVYEKQNLSGYDCKAFYPGPADRISDKYEDEKATVNLYTFSDGVERVKEPII